MARPKLTIAQCKCVQITVRMRLDLNEGSAAVASLRGTTKSGLVSQYAAEQIRLEQERDRPRFDATVKGIRFQREAQRRKKSAQSLIAGGSNAPERVKAINEERPLTSPWCLESRPHDRLIEPLYDSGKRVTHATRGSLSLLARGPRTACGESLASPFGTNPAPEDRQ
jgi:hypothetical protein